MITGKQVKLFLDRFDPEYLKFLRFKLTKEELLKTAIIYPKKVIFDNRIISYKKCIRIDFCGLAANTLFDTRVGRGSNLRTAELRQKISEQFLSLFTKSTLRWFNSHGVYLKVRFCFSYLYGDYPVCLMVAEHPKNWQHMGRNPSREFLINPPATFEKLQY